MKVSGTLHAAHWSKTVEIPDKIQQIHQLSHRWCSQFSAAPNPHQQALCKGRICYLRRKTPRLECCQKLCLCFSKPCFCEYTSPRGKSSLRSLYQIALCSQHKLIFSNHLKANEMSTCKFKTGASCTADEFMSELLNKPGSVLWL